MDMFTRKIFTFFVLPIFLVGCVSLPMLGKNKKEEKENPQVIINTKLGLAYLQQGDLKKAQDKLNKAIALNVKYAPAHHYLAEAYRQQGEAVKANAEFLKAIELAGNDAALHNNYGVFLCGTGHYTEAETQFLIATNNPTYVSVGRAYENAGLCMLKMNDPLRAQLYFRQALEHNAELPKAIYHSAKMNFEKGRTQAAKDFIARYERLDEHTAKTLWLAIQVNKALGDFDAVATYSRLLIEGFKDSKEYRKLIGLEDFEKEQQEEKNAIATNLDDKKETIATAEEGTVSEDFSDEDFSEETFDAVSDEVEQQPKETKETLKAEDSSTTSEEFTEDDFEEDTFDAVTDTSAPDTSAAIIAEDIPNVPATAISTPQYEVPNNRVDLNGDGIPDEDINGDGIADSEQEDNLSSGSTLLNTPDTSLTTPDSSSNNVPGFVPDPSASGFMAAPPRGR